MNRKDPVTFARDLRRKSTSSEEYLWQLLRNRQRCGKKVRRQHPVGIYTTDFFCVEALLDIEIDGTPHQTVEGKEKDDVRDAWMRSQGIEVLRFSGREVEFETQDVLKLIDEVLLQRCPSSPALLPGVPGRREHIFAGTKTQRLT